MKFYSYFFLLCIVFCYFIKKKKYLKGNPFLYVLVYSTFSMLFLNMTNAVYYWMMLLVAVLMFYLPLGNNTIITISNLFVIISVVCSLGVFFQVFFPNQFYIVTDSIHMPGVAAMIRYNADFGVINGVLGEASYTSFVIIIGFVILLCSIPYRKNKLIVIVLSIMMYASLIILGKRNFILSVPAAVLVTYLVKKYKQDKSKAILIIMAISIVLSVMYPLFLGDTLSLILKKGNAGYNGINFSNREEFWDIAINMFKESPVFGKGMNSFDIVYSSKIPNELSFVGAHNSYIQFLAEFGIVGTIIYVKCILKCFHISFNTIKCSYPNIVDSRLRYLSESYFAILIVLIIYGLTGNPFYQPQEFFLFILIVCFQNNIIKNNVNTMA